MQNIIKRVSIPSVNDMLCEHNWVLGLGWKIKIIRPTTANKVQRVIFHLHIMDLQPEYFPFKCHSCRTQTNQLKGSSERLLISKDITFHVYDCARHKKSK